MTRHVFTGDDLWELLRSVFPNAILIDQQFRISIAGQKIHDQLGYSPGDLHGQPISILSKELDLTEWLKTQLTSGYFNVQGVQIEGKDKTVEYTLSGCYLGLVTDINNYIIINFVPSPGIYEEQLDDFIYHSAHELRGPLATLRGLIGLLRDASEPKEIQFLTEKMNLYANKLDGLLGHLIHFTQPSSEGHKTLSAADSLPRLLTATVREIFNRHDIQLTHDNHGTLDQLPGADALPVLFKNLVQFLYHHNQDKLDHIHLSTTVEQTSIRIQLLARRTRFLPIVSEKLLTLDFADPVMVLNSPEMTYPYTMNKILKRLKGTLEFRVLPSGTLCITISLPLQRCVA